MREEPKVANERVIFGLIIIGGYVALLFGLPAFQILTKMATGNAITLDNAVVQMVDKGLAVLGTALGAIVAAIWRSDKTERQAANTIDTLASKVATPPAAPEQPTPPLAATPLAPTP